MYERITALIHPKKWRETEDPFKLPYSNFKLKEIIGYPHAGNDVFQAKGVYNGRCVEVYIKVARQRGADIKNEIDTINAINCPLAPQIIDHDDRKEQFVVTLAKERERMSTIVGDNTDLESLDYMYEYGRTLAQMHGLQGKFHEVKDRVFFHIPDIRHFEDLNLMSVYKYLTENRPKEIHKCFCHGDFHYANILWKNGHMSAILDFELSGLGNREFDIAWALILRPGQKFLSTTRELELFMEGYCSAGFCDFEYVKYYMVLIYSYFYKFGGGTPGYCEYVDSVFRNYC